MDRACISTPIQGKDEVDLVLRVGRTATPVEIHAGTNPDVSGLKTFLDRGLASLPPWLLCLLG